MYNVITIGSAMRDVFMRSKQIRIMKDSSFSTGEASCFALGSKIDIDEILFETGGGATNTAVGFERQGLQSAIVGRIGHDDGRGREVLRELAREGVNTSLVVKDRHNMTAYSVLLLTPSGERTGLIYRGASAQFRRQEIPWRRMNAKWLYISALGGNLSLLKSIFSFAHRKDIKTAWNPGVAELAKGYTKLKPLMKAASLVLLNREEATSLMGVGYSKDRNAFMKLSQGISGILVITEGSHGAFAHIDGRTYHSGTRKINVVDTTGAGDAFGCGFVGAYIHTKGDIKRSLEFATLNSESVLEHVGAKAGLLWKNSKRGRIPVVELHTGA
jgi:ribokinase